MFVSIKEIERWLREDYPIGPDWMVYPDKSHDDFQGFTLDQVHQIIQNALLHYGQCPLAKPEASNG
jgi:hypothetical protein